MPLLPFGSLSAFFPAFEIFFKYWSDGIAEGVAIFSLSNNICHFSNLLVVLSWDDQSITVWTLPPSTGVDNGMALPSCDPKITVWREGTGLSVVCSSLVTLCSGVVEINLKTDDISCGQCLGLGLGEGRAR